MKPLKKYLILLLTLSVFNIVHSQIQKDTIDKSEELFDVSKVVLNDHVDINCYTPPLGFDTSTFFNGYLNLGQGGMIRLTEYTNFPTIEYHKSLSMNQDRFIETGMALINTDQVTLPNGNIAYLMKFEYSSEEPGVFGSEYCRYLVYTGESSTLLIDAVHPKQEKMEGDIIKSLKSISYNQ